MTAEIVYLFGRPHEMPPMVTTADLAPTLNLCDEPTVSAVCETLVRRSGHDQPCGGLLAYQGGAWQHVNACRDCVDSPLPCPGDLGHVSCDDPQPSTCIHDGCTDTAEYEMQCTRGGEGECCGCCWVRNDELEGRRMWTR